MRGPISVVALVRVSKGEVLPVQFLDLERFQVDPVDGAHVDGELPPLGFQHATQGQLELVHDMHATGRTERVLGRFGGELVDGEVFSALELDFFFPWVEP